MTELPDLSNLSLLEDQVCSYSQLTQLPDLSHNTALTALDCSFNPLTSLPDLSALTSLAYLYCDHNELTQLPDFSQNGNLLRLECNDNDLTELSLPPQSIDILCWNNLLDESSCTALEGNDPANYVQLAPLDFSDWPSFNIVCLLQGDLKPIVLDCGQL